MLAKKININFTGEISVVDALKDSSVAIGLQSRICLSYFLDILDKCDEKDKKATLDLVSIDSFFDYTYSFVLNYERCLYSVSDVFFSSFCAFNDNCNNDFYNGYRGFVSRVLKTLYFLSTKNRCLKNASFNRKKPKLQSGIGREILMAFKNNVIRKIYNKSLFEAELTNRMLRFKQNLGTFSLPEFEAVGSRCYVTYKNPTIENLVSTEQLVTEFVVYKTKVVDFETMDYYLCEEEIFEKTSSYYNDYIVIKIKTNDFTQLYYNDVSKIFFTKKEDAESHCKKKADLIRKFFNKNRNTFII